jgi:hypothetical protein
MRGGAQRGVIERCWRDKKSKRRWLRRKKAAEREISTEAVSERRGKLQVRAGKQALTAVC